MGGAVWVLIPVVAILAGVASDYIKMREKQSRLGSSTEELDQLVTDLKHELQEQQAAYEKRIANLETIITSQVWDTLQDPSLSKEEQTLLMPNLVNEISDSRKAELLAEKIK